jgi:N6-adenosine-specific RNA methylase IME4
MNKAYDKQLTGYSLYNVDAKKRVKQNPLDTIFPALPEKKFDIIYADPPWDYGGKLQFDKTSTCQERLDLARKIFISSAEFKYPTLKTSELMELPVHEIAKDDSLLFMWSTNPHLEQAIALGKAWGFDYKTVAFIWNKCNHNPGQYTLSNCELCLVFKHGRIPKPRGARNIQQLISVPRQGHSVKPIEVLDNITAMFPTQKKIELFSRRIIRGWDAWGLDLELADPDKFELK